MEIQNNEKRDYIAPVFDRVELDNQISLALESIPPGGPDEGYLKVRELFNNTPYNNNLG